MEICKGYTGVTCVNGNCPRALIDQYLEYGIPIVKSCKECSYYKGCEDCCWEGREECVNSEHRK